MLVHKETLGVLETAPWDGQFRVIDGVKIPLIRRASLENLELDPAEWWEIPNNSTVAHIIHSCWPWFDPIIENDELIDAIRWPSWRIYDEPEPASKEVKPSKKKRPRRRSMLKLL